jgi:hypothetical protein
VGSSSEVLLESAAVERGMAKLFRGKVQPFGSSGLRFTQSALLAAVAIVGLKSLVEFIRLQTLGKAGEWGLINAGWATAYWVSYGRLSSALQLCTEPTCSAPVGKSLPEAAR